MPREIGSISTRNSMAGWADAITMLKAMKTWTYHSGYKKTSPVDWSYGRKNAFESQARSAFPRRRLAAANTSSGANSPTPRGWWGSSPRPAAKALRSISRIFIIMWARPGRPNKRYVCCYPPISRTTSMAYPEMKMAAGCRLSWCFSLATGFSILLRRDCRSMAIGSPVFSKKVTCRSREWKMVIYP